MELKNRLTGAVVTASLLLSLGGVGTVHAATSAEDTRIAFGAAAAREKRQSNRRGDLIRVGPSCKNRCVHPGSRIVARSRRGQ